MCLSCKSLNRKQKLNSNGMPSRKTSKASRQMTVEDYRKIMITKKKPTKHKYTYLYSENYQSIEKLLNSCGKNFNLQMDDVTIDEDLRIFQEIESRIQKEFDIAVKTENLEKRGIKRFANSCLKA